MATGKSEELLTPDGASIHSDEDAYFSKGTTGNEAELVFETKGCTISDPDAVLCHVNIGALKTTGHPLDRKVRVTPLSFSSMWYTLTDLPSSLPEQYAGVASCSQGPKLYVSGLGDQNTESWCFDLETRTWEQYGNLGHKRDSHCMVECNGHVYVLGGRVPGSADCVVVKQIEVLDNSTKKWLNAGTLIGSVCFNACACLVEGNIYVYGVLDDTRKNILLQKYSPQIGLSECYASVVRGENDGATGIVSVKNHFILSNNDDTHVCSIQTNPKMKPTIKKCALYELSLWDSVICLSEDDDYLIAIGGESRGSGNPGYFVYRASVSDVIANTGGGWEPVDMRWPTGELMFYPGALCNAKIQLIGMDEKIG